MFRKDNTNKLNKLTIIILLFQGQHLALVRLLLKGLAGLRLGLQGLAGLGDFRLQGLAGNVLGLLGLSGLGLGLRGLGLMFLPFNGRLLLRSLLLGRFLRRLL